MERYACLADPASGWTRSPWNTQIAEADKRGNSATEDARRAALKILRKAVKDGVTCGDVTLFHMVTIARDSASVSADIAAAKLREAELDAADASVIAVLVAEQAGARRPGPSGCRPCWPAGRLREAKAAAASLPPEGERADAMQQVEAAPAAA